MTRVHSTSGRDPYWVRVASRTATTRRLFCFPYAGGGPASFMKLVPEVESGTELLLLQLPGEFDATQPRPAMMALLDDIALHTCMDDGIPSVFFGHSLGGIMAFETARRCAAPALKGLIVSGCIAPCHWPTGRAVQLATLDNTEFVKALGDYQGMPAALLENAELLQFFLPILRTHFSLVAGYRYAPGARLAIPLAVLSGSDDPTVAPARLLGWRLETSGPMDFYTLRGHHFFFEQHSSEVLALANTMFDSGMPASADQIFTLEI